MTTWLIIALLVAGPTPAGPGTLEALPADFDAVARVRGVTPVAHELRGMIEAMSPALAEQLNPRIDEGVDGFVETFGPEAAESSFLVVMPLPDAEAMQPGAEPPFAIVVEDVPYAGVKRSIAGADEVEAEAQDGGYESIRARDGETVYTFDGDSFVAVSPHEDLIARIAVGVGDGPSLAAAIGERGVTRLYGGDAGLYVDLEAVGETYGEQLAQVRQQFFQAIETASQQQGNAGMMDGVVAFYEKIFDAMGNLRSVVVALDAEEEGLSIGVELGVAPGSDAAETLASFGTGTAEGPERTLPRLPADAAYFFSFSGDAGAMAALQRMGMSMYLAPGQETPPEVADAIETMAAAGRIRAAGASSFDDGIHQVYLIELDDPAAYAEAMQELYRAMGEAQGIVGEMIKEVDIEPAAETYEDVAMTRVSMTLDLEAMGRAQGAAGGATVNALRAIFGGETITTWVGVKDRFVVFVNAPDWDEARDLIDRVRKAEGAVGDEDAYKTVMAGMPEEVSGLVLVNMKGLVRQFASMFSAMFDAKIAVPEDLGEGPALIGVSVIATEAGLSIDVTVPSPVGRVIEHGLIPIFQQLQGVERP